MENSKIIGLLRNMPAEDLKSLRRWIKVHGVKKDAYRLFEYLFKHLAATNPEKLSKETIFRVLFRNKNYNDLKLRYMSFELLRMCEDFVVFRSVSKNQNQYQLYLLEYYRQHGLSKFFEQIYSSLRESMKAQTIRDSNYFFASMSLNSEYNKYLKSKQNRAIEPNIQRLSDDLDIFYLLNKLKVYSEALNYKNILKVDYNIRFVDHLLKEISQIGIDQYPALKIYYYALLTLIENEKEEYFYELKKNIQQYKKVFETEELQGTYTLARNYCIKKINLGNKKFVRELFELYQWELELINESETKELRIRYRTDVGDLETKLKQAREFLTEGHKVKFTMRFKGREAMYVDLGVEKFEQIIQRLGDIAIIDDRSPPYGRQIQITFAPAKQSGH